MPNYISVVEIAWDSGKEYYSFQGVSAPSQYYEDKLLNIGKIVREVSLEPGENRIADSFIELDNLDNYFGSLKYSIAYFGTVVTAKIIDAETGEDFAELWTAAIYDWRIRDYKIWVGLRDQSWINLSAECDSGLDFGDKFFPNRPIESKPGMLPIGLGQLYSGSDRGCVPGRLYTESNPYKYIFIANRVETLGFREVYVYDSLKTVTVDFTVTTEVIDGVTRDIITFTADQRDANKADQTEVSADIDGYGAIGGSAVDAFTILRQALIELLGFETSDSFPLGGVTSDARDKLIAKNIRARYLVRDGETAIEVLKRFADSFNLFPFRLQNGISPISALLMFRRVRAISR